MKHNKHLPGLHNSVLLFVALIATLSLVWAAHAANSRVEFSSPLESPLAEQTPQEQPADSWGIPAVERSNDESMAPSYEHSVEGEIAIAYYAQKHNVDIAQLFMGQSGIVTLPETGKKLWRASVGVLTNEIEMQESITIVMATGQVIDFEAAKSAEEQLYRERYGKLNPDLHHALLEAKDDELFAIDVWYRAENVNKARLDVAAKYPEAKLQGTSPGMETDPLLWEVIREEMHLAELAVLHETSEPILKWITQQGFEVTYTSRYAPTFNAIMSKQAIKALEMREDIASISLEQTYHPTGFNTLPIKRAD